MKLLPAFRRRLNYVRLSKQEVSTPYLVQTCTLFDTYHDQLLMIMLPRHCGL